MPILLDMISTTPGGLHIAGRTHQEVGRFLFDNYIDSQWEKDRRCEATRRLDFYHGRQFPYIKAQIDRHYSHPELVQMHTEMLKESAFQNLVQRIIDETSTVFAEPAKRTVTNTQANYDNHLKITQYQQRMEVVNQYTNLLNETLAWCGVVVEGETNEPRFRIVTGDKMWAVSDIFDPTRERAFILDLPASGVERTADEPWFVVYSADEKFFLNKSGKLVSFNWPEGTEFWAIDVAKNPLNRIPGYLVHRSVVTDRLMDPDSGSDLIAAQEAVNLLNLLLLDEQKSGAVLVYQQGGIKETPTGQPLNRRFMAQFPEGTSVGSLDMKADPASYIATAREVINQIAANRGLGPDSFSLTSTASSGFEVQIKRTKLREMRREQEDEYRVHDEQITICGSVVNKTDASPKFRYNPDGYHIDFGEQEVPRSAMEKLQVRRAARGLGLSNPVMEAMQDNPDFDEKRAKEFVEENIQIWMNFLEAIKAMNTPLDGDVENPGQTPQDNGGEGEGDGDGGAEDEDTVAKVNAATALIRAGFEPQAALSAVGLDPIKHFGLLPVTLKVDDK